MMEIEHSLLDAVLENPDDDLPRLVYADWLDENGDSMRAEFIRAQIVLYQAVLRNAYDSDEYASSSKTMLQTSSSQVSKWLIELGFQINFSKYDAMDNKCDTLKFLSESSKTIFTWKRGFIASITSYPIWFMENMNSIDRQPFSNILVITSNDSSFHLSRAQDGHYNIDYHVSETYSGSSPCVPLDMIISRNDAIRELALTIQEDLPRNPQFFN